jgi:3-oxoacyl-[acyl-carrier-protein] synthase II
MADAGRDVFITGIGIVSCLGEGPEAHWQGLCSGHPQADSTTYPPFVIHRIGPLDLDKQIPKKGDQRQMEPWQRIGVYAAGLALDSAGIKGKPDILAHTDMIVAAGGGERDIAADSAILSGLPAAANPEAFLNERLMSDLRPTLFLAQLSNLLAGNISIVHGVTGSSRTFMGEEAAGVDAVRIALSRINAGQSDIALVGGSYNSERPDILMMYEFGGYNLKDKFAPVWQREAKPGFATATMGAFLVIESGAHAAARDAKRIARRSCPSGAGGGPATSPSR